MARSPGLGPHDAFFKHMLSDVGSVDAFLREHLHADIAGVLTAALPQRINGSFVSPQLRRYHTDLLFRVCLRTEAGGEREALAFIIFEHKSAPDPLTPLQVLGYMLRIWESWLADKHGLPLPPVLSVVVHHGPQGWRGSTAFRDMFGDLPPALARAVPDFVHELVDLSSIADDQLSHQNRLKAFLIAMKYVLRSDLDGNLEPVLRAAQRLDRMEIERILLYLDSSPIRIDPARLAEAAEAVEENHRGDTMSILDVLEERGLQKGLARGLARGKAETLLQLVEKRFGAPSDAYRARIEHADLEQLNRWIDRVLDAADIAGVLD